MANGIWLRNRSGRKEVWIVFKDETGKKHRQKVGLDTSETRTLATATLNKRRHHVDIGKHMPEWRALHTTFAEVADKYWDEFLHKADKSWASRFKELKAEFGGMKLMDVNAVRIQNWYGRKRAKSKVGAGNVNRTYSLLCSIFNAAINWDMYILANPAKKIRTEPDPPPLTRFLTIPEIEKFYESCDPGILPIIVFFLLTGLRKMEVLDFEWKDVDLERLEIRADRLKRGKHPEIPVDDKLRHLLLVLGPRQEGRLFDMPKMTFRRRFEAARKKSRLAHFTLRDLRRTFGSHFAMATLDLPVLARLFGHGSMQMVNTTYVHLLNSHVRTQMKKFDAAMPDLPASLREFVPIGIGHHPGHQAVVAEVVE